MNRFSFVFYAAAHPLRAVISAAVLGAMLGAAVASTVPPRAKVSLAITISQRSLQETTEYAYDGYYALRAAELVSDTMISWFSTPSVIRDIHAEAGLELSEAEALAAAGRAFRAKKYSSQSVVVAFSAPDAASARALSDAASRVVSDRAAALALSSGGESLFHATASEPVVAMVSPSPAVFGTAGAFLGAFLGFALAYAARARKGPQL